MKQPETVYWVRGTFYGSRGVRMLSFGMGAGAYAGASSAKYKLLCA